MRVVFLGTAPFAVPSLQALHRDPSIQTVLVVTQPDRPRGRGQRCCPGPVKEEALRLSIPVLQPERINGPGPAEGIRAARPDVLVVVAYGQLLGRELLEMAPGGAVNLHASLLPRYRGAAPVHWALLEGAESTGVCTMYMNEELDAGDVIHAEEVAVPADANRQELEELLAGRGARLLLQSLRAIREGTAPRTEQDGARATRAPAVRPGDRWIDWSQSGPRTVNRIRAMAPVPGAITRAGDTVLQITRARYLPELPGPGTAGPGGEHGQVVRAGVRTGLFVRVPDGYIQVERLKPPGKREMDARDFLNGQRLPEGMVFRKEDG